MTDLVQDAGIVLTLVLMEAVLSFDNAAILAAIVRRLPPRDRRKALLYGLVGAYAMRIGAILLATVLIRTPGLKLAGGAYLAFLAIRHFVQLVLHRRRGHAAPRSNWLARFGVPALVATIIQIEVIDFAFAIDQVLVAVAFTDKVALIIVAAMLGILALRLAASVMARVMDWLPLLEHSAYLAVGYAGVKLMLLYPFVPGGYHIPTTVSLGVTLGLFAVPVAVKLLFGWPRSRPTGAVEEKAAALKPLEPAGLRPPP